MHVRLSHQDQTLQLARYLLGRQSQSEWNRDVGVYFIDNAIYQLCLR